MKRACLQFTGWRARCAWGLVAAALAAAAPAADSTTVRQQFVAPSRDYSTAPLWVWNDLLTEEQIAATMEDLASQKVKQVFVHPRPGLMTPYLSDDWFRLWKRALREAERLDMNVWIYDENSYPSGFAGGLVPAAMPESRGQGLAFREVKQLPRPSAEDNILAVYRLAGQQAADVTTQFRAGEALPDGSYLLATRTLAPVGGWFGGKYYVDLLKPGVTEKFLEITMDAYQREIGGQFGKRVPGVFTDEPHLAPAGGLHWSDHLPQLFQQRWGYDLLAHLPSLTRPVGDWRRVRHNYYQLLLEQFIECWAKPFHDYCARHSLEFTGHYWEHGWPGASHGSDNMAMYAWHQRPAIDTLMNQYDEGVNAQFGNVRAVLELGSVANQLGRERTLCEAYGAGGWDLRFEDMKRIGDWLYVLGVNTLDEHLSYITIRGARKRDHPQSFSYHEPWWDSYHVMAEYFTRLSLVMSSGQQINRILVLEPTTSAWMYQGQKELATLGNQFQELVTTLAKRQVEFDLGCEDIIQRHGSVADGQFIVGQRQYDIVLLPPMTENLNGKTFELLREFGSQGGAVFCCGPPPARIDGQETERGAELAKLNSFRPIEVGQAADRLLANATGGFSVRPDPQQTGILFHHRRQLADGDFLLLVNTSIESGSAGAIHTPARGVQKWDLRTGQIRPYAFRRDGDGLQCDFTLAPCGSLLLFLSKEAADPAPSVAVKEERLPATGALDIRRLEPNVLTLDYVDVTVNGQTKANLYFYHAADFVFKQHGMSGNPWDRSVQFRDELISRKFPADSGFQASYRFTVRERVPAKLEMVIERPDLYAIACNGQPVKAAENAWWLDRSFGRIDITSAVRVGENAVTIAASPMTIYHELESAYLLGDFALEPTDTGFVLVPDRPLTVERRPGHGNAVESTMWLSAGSGLGLSGVGWNAQGHPFYASGVSYAQSFDIDRPEGKYVVRLGEWHGSLARVLVNGKLAGHIVHQPWECDVTAAVTPGSNRIEVEVVGTLKNTLGPHHAGTLRGSAWPHAFQQGPETGPPPGLRYDTIGYGLFEPFAVVNRK